MDRFLKPERFSADPNQPDAAEIWKHWLCTFQNFLDSISEYKPNELKTLFNYISPSVYRYIADCSDYDSALSTLQSMYIQPKGEVFARHVLATCKQENTETLDQFAQRLRTLSRDCNFQAVTAQKNQDDAVRDAFIIGIQSNSIRQRLLENSQLNFEKAFTQAKSLELAQKQAEYIHVPHPNVYGASAVQQSPDKQDSELTELAAVNQKSICFFCGNLRHPRFKCPARNAICNNCSKKGHFQKVCRANKTAGTTATVNPSLSGITTAAAPLSLRKSVTEVIVNGIPLQALVDTGSTESYVSQSIVYEHNWIVHPSHNEIVLASTTSKSQTRGHCFVSLQHDDCSYPSIRLSVLANLCADVLLGHDFLQLHRSVTINFTGSRPPLNLCNVAAASICSPPLFAHLRADCRPIATRSRRHSPTDEVFITSEVKRLMRDGVIEKSNSPWRAQVLVTTNERHKKRMVIDYSQTINRFTFLDGYPLPKIDEVIEKVSQYRVYSALDLESAYHQIPILEHEKIYTAFEANHNLYQFCRIPFGVTNGVACFQRTINEIIRSEGLSGTFAYVDNITVCGNDQADHDQNLKKFLSVATKYGLTLNRSKCTFGSTSIRLLGYELTDGTIKPDPERFDSLFKMPPPTDLPAQQRIVGLFAYYSNWISHFSDKIHTLIHNDTFPIPENVRKQFEALKAELLEAVLVTIDKTLPLNLETDASDIAIAATLNQSGRPVAFFSRTLSPSERHHSSVEKEACAIVEAVRKWRHYLLGTHFQIITDQRSVSFMFDSKDRGKIKNDKIQRWRVELSPFSYDIIYRPGKENPAADALSRVHCSSVSNHELRRLHDTLCHPGVTRLNHFVKAKNLPFSTADIKEITQSCRICAEIKPQFFKPPQMNLIKATQPFERLSIDFKGPLPSNTRNKYLLTIIDEYSRFPFAYPCPNVSASAVISCLTDLFSMFGLPGYIHSDRGSAFMSEELRSFLHQRGVATSRTTAYNPRCNGQVERLNATLWKAVTLAVRTRSIAINNWEAVLPEALHSIRSLLCTSTNATPHERMFVHHRKSPAGTSLPEWLINPGSVLIQRNNRLSKYEPVVEEAELLECNPQYAHVRYTDGREETVSLRQVAPAPPPDTSSHSVPTTEFQQPPSPIPLVKQCDSPTPSASEDLLCKQQRTRPYFLRNREA